MAGGSIEPLDLKREKIYSVFLIFFFFTTENINLNTLTQKEEEDEDENIEKFTTQD